MTAEVLEFPRVGDIVKRSTVVCMACKSRALRVVTPDDDDDAEWLVECFNCGDVLEGISVLWDHS
jgi:hypothetical protein